MEPKKSTWTLPPGATAPPPPPTCPAGPWEIPLPYSTIAADDTPIERRWEQARARQRLAPPPVPAAITPARAATSSAERKLRIPEIRSGCPNRGIGDEEARS